MNFSKMTCVVAAAVLGAGTLPAQEMGAAVATASAPAPKPAAAAPSMATPADQGQQIVVENQRQEPTVKLSAKGEDANSAVQKVLRARKLKQGYDPERGSIIQIGLAMDNVKDPTGPDVMLTRELLARQAELDAKIQIASVVRRQMNGATRVNTPGTKEHDEFLQKFASEIAAAEQQKATVAELLQALDPAEGGKLANTVVDAQWKQAMEGIIGRLDEKYGQADIAPEKQQQYLKVKAAYEQAKTQMDDLTQKKNALYPRQTVETEAESYAEMKLCGAVDLVQAESWDGKRYQVAVAVVWSPKLQERALATIGCGMPVGGKPGEKSLDDWLQEQAEKGELARLVGTRQYVDDKGRQYVLGFSAAEIPEDATDYEDAITATDLLAQQAVGFYLFSDGNGATGVKASMSKFKGRSADVAAQVSRQMVQAMPKDFAIQGLGKVFSTKCRHEISGKDIYVSVAAVDSVLAGKSNEILRKWYEAASIVLNPPAPEEPADPAQPPAPSIKPPALLPAPSRPTKPQVIIGSPSTDDF